MNKDNNPLPPRPPKFLTMGFFIPPYKGVIERFDPSDIIEGEEAIRKDDEEQARLKASQQNTGDPEHPQQLPG